ncbi:hypothetical protein AGOR_G00024960 [Albula goreensis]|uniref:TSC22 domain family, member 4 n=1 Tax=Albula goreensis TaxID=1534307 RepID=A0A8T3E8R3_9TELE|nr:hypothetical protein AGOR_G00024960 [Albula goreensis]
MTDKKRGSFQITSVTLDFDRASAESSQKAAFPDSDGPRQQQPIGNPPATGGQGRAHSPSCNSELPSACPGTGGSKRGVLVVAEPVDSLVPPTFLLPSSPGSFAAGKVGEGEACCVGSALLDLSRTALHSSSSSQPGTPLSIRKQFSLDQGGAQCWLPGPTPQSPSRFRVVRLGQGLGEPYCRGRWTCIDFLDRDGLDKLGLRRVMENMRHTHSLDLVDMTGLGISGGEGAVLAPSAHIHTLNSGYLDNSQGTLGVLASDTGSGEGTSGKPSFQAEEEPDSPAGEHPAEHPPRDSPLHTDQSRLKPEDVLCPPLMSNIPCSISRQHQQGSFPFLSASRHLLLSRRSGHSTPALHLDLNIKPESLATPLNQERGLHHSVASDHSSSALSLAQSMFGVGGAFDLDSESGSSKSMMAIDSKIEQAMDLVKTHLMLAVREEVELLREQIAELTERNTQLERENYFLRSMKERE